ncbi:hypothetical protein Tco_0519411 [Tanacetum coccineum]
MKAEALKEQTTASRPIKALTMYPPNTPATLVPRVLPTKSQVKINIFALIQLFSEFEKTCKKRITPTGLTEGERGFEQTKECYLTEVIPFFKTLKEHFEGIQKALTKEINKMKEIFKELEAEVDQNVVNMKHDEIERKNLLIANDNLIADCLSKEVFYIATNSELNVSRFAKMHATHIVVQARCLELEAKLSKLLDKALTKEIKEMKDIFEELKAEVDQNAVNRKHGEIEQKNILIAHDNLFADCLSKDVFYIVTNFELTVSRFTKMHDAHTIVQARCLELEAEISNLRDKLKYQNLKESFGNNPPPPARVTPDFDSVFETRSNVDRTLDFRALDFQITHLTEKVTVLQEQNELFRAENEKVKQHYKELKVKKTLREIVEEAKVEIPFDRSLASACLYTKHSQELLEYAIGTCSKAFNQRDKKHAPTLIIRKKQVTFKEQCDTSNNSTHKHVEQLNTQKTNVHVPPSTGVNCCTNAS